MSAAISPATTALPNTPIDTLIHARWIVPVDSHRTVLEHHSLAIANDRIVAIVPTAEARQQLQARSTVELTDHALIPGFINSHGHTPMSLLRGYADDLPVNQWLEQHIWPAEQTLVNEAFVYDGAQLAIAEMIRSGTTTFSDNYFFPQAVGQAAMEAGMRAQLMFTVLDMPTPWASDADGHITKGLEVLDYFRYQDTITVGFGPHAPYSTSDSVLKKIVTLSEQLDLNVQMHIHESAQEITDALQQTGMRPLRRLANLGLLSPRLQCVHMTQLNDDDIQLIVDNNCSVIHCPESNLKLASGFTPVAHLQKQGINIALGTDGCASNNDLDMLGEMRTAALIAKAVAQDATALDAWSALEAATINGAKAMGLEAEIGSLACGKKADIAAIRMTELENLPLYNPLSQLVYTCTRNQFTHVWCNGRLLMDNRHLTTLDENAIKAKALQWQARIAQL